MLQRVLGFVGIWCALLGWSLVALALAQRGPLFGIAIAGFAAALFQKRAFLTTLVFEVVLFECAGSLVIAEGFWFLWAGGFLIAFGRVSALLLARFRE